jgi:hypothetical protein
VTAIATTVQESVANATIAVIAAVTMTAHNITMDRSPLRVPSARSMALTVAPL